MFERFVLKVDYSMRVGNGKVKLSVGRLLP